METVSNKNKKMKKKKWRKKTTKNERKRTARNEMKWNETKSNVMKCVLISSSTLQSLNIKTIFLDALPVAMAVANTQHTHTHTHAQHPRPTRKKNDMKYRKTREYFVPFGSVSASINGTINRAIIRNQMLCERKNYTTKDNNNKARQ